MVKAKIHCREMILIASCLSERAREVRVSALYSCFKTGMGGGGDLQKVSKLRAYPRY